MDFKKVLGWGLAIVAVLVLINVGAGYAYHYGWIPAPPPNLFGRPEVARTLVVAPPQTVVVQDDRPRFKGLQNFFDERPVVAQTTAPASQWEPVDNTNMPIPDGWAPVNQGPGCPQGQHREATGKRQQLPDGRMRVEEACVPN